MRRSDLLTPELIKELQAHAVEAHPHEACGVVLEGGRYERAPNLAADPARHAELPLELLSRHLQAGDLVAVAHSHPNGPNCPSATDMRTQMEYAVPFIITATNGQGCLQPFAWGDQLETLPLLKRTFQHGVTDCYELIRDHRWLEFGERLPQFPRSWAWWETDEHLYLDGVKKSGYHVLPREECPQVGDICFMQIGGRRVRSPNHAGVLVSPGEIMHHCTGKNAYDPMSLSRREPYARWNHLITHWVRRNAS